MTSTEITAALVAGLRARITSLKDQTFDAQTTLDTLLRKNAKKSDPKDAKKSTRKKMSQAARRKISERMKARWQAKRTVQNGTDTPAETLDTLSVDPATIPLAGNSTEGNA